jgi:prepilin-type N-terminal cleavage/methylation domain-containing protein
VTNRATDAGYTLLEVLIVAGLIGVLSAIAIPMTANSLRNFRIGGDTRNISGMIALAKLRAASAFSRTRVYIDLGAKSYRLETQKSAGDPWLAEGGTNYLSVGVTLGHGGLSSSPPNTQGPIAQAPSCRDASNTAIVDTACVMFNSRGIPIDWTGTPTGIAAVYVTDGMVVDGITVSATGLTQVWQRFPSSETWAKQ